METSAYLERIGLKGPLVPDLESLTLLQRHHLTAVPFENLDVFAGRGTRTDDLWTVSKVVERGRGGWCFELNGAFATLLTGLGFQVTRLAATVEGSTAPMPTHLTLEVQLERPYLVDVGFGDSFINPIPLDSEGPHDGGSGWFGLREEGAATTLVSIGDDGDETPQYRFRREPRRAEDFEEASTYLQTTPGLQWTVARFATRLLDGGPDRVTLVRDRLRLRRDGTWTEESVAPEDWESRLEEWFGLTP